MENPLPAGFSSYLSRSRDAALHYCTAGGNCNEKKFTYLSYIILLVFVLTTLISAQNINALDNANLQWKAIGPPGGRVYSLAINPQMPHIIYGESEGGVFKSTNGGTTSELLEGYQACPVISPIDPNLMIAGLYRTTDGGTSWDKMETAGWPYAFHPTDENIIYAINGYPEKNIIVSYNKGLNWDTLKTSTESLSIIKTTSLNDSILFLLTLNNLYKSIDGGNNWSLILTAEYGDMFGSCFVISDSMLYLVTDIWRRYVPTNPTKFYRSTNLGDSWEVDSSITFLQSSPANVIISNPVNSSIVYLATGDYLYGYIGDVCKSTDSGSSWRKMNNGLPTPYNRYLYALAINPLDPKNLYVGSYGWGVYKTTTGGENWKQTNLTNATVYSIHIDENNSNIIYACTIDEGVLKTTNGGLEWQSLNLGIPQTVQRPFFKIAFDPNNSNLAYIASQYGVFKSTDAGNNWDITSLLGDFDHYVDEISVHPKGSDTLYAGIIGWLNRKDLYRSVDEGNTWTNLRLTNGEEGVAQVLFDPINPDIIYIAAFSKGIYKSTDGGITWTQMNNGLKISDPPLYELVKSLSIDVTNPNILYSDNGGVIKTTNGGENWFRIDSSLFELEENIKVSRVAYINGKVYVSSNNFMQGDYSYYYIGGLYVTSNEGLTWSKLRKFKITTPGPGEVKTNPINPKEIFISTMTGIYKGVDTVTSVERNKDIPESIHLFQNFPNPFNPTTKISFQLKKEGLITIKIYNILGKEVKILLKDDFSPGYYEIIWDGTNYSGEKLTSGIYFYTLKTEGYLEVKKMIILR